MSQPGVIDGFPFARAGSEVRGKLAQGQLPRLAEMHCGVREIAYRIQGALNEHGKPCLRVVAQGTLGLTCQRCLGSLEFPVAVEVELELSESLREIEGASDDVDRVLASRNMEVAQIVEDEVILCVPMSPVHDDCRLDLEEKRTEQHSPFGILRQLKRH